MVSVPSRDEVRQAIVDLLEGRRSREEVDRWAAPWATLDDLPEIDDELVWDTLDWLFGCATIDPSNLANNGYLFGEADFRAWLEEFDAAVARGE
ncbi:hypothetical protein GCM10009676_08170 [Prauserella halophila]|uniref:Uncharacterized protein n=1 Tax=Prauserella halophila TaxID=185641 RepID=A0ABP4GKS1_9PSEU|nr:hypothetical protein [Prauserella halophila]MCP2235183.1 hypothetical protein [Prauserella halophila]